MLVKKQVTRKFYHYPAEDNCYDLTAIPFGSLIWYDSDKSDVLNDKYYFHNSEAPSIITSTGTEVWFFNNKVHRNNGPADINHTIYFHSIYYAYGVSYERKADWFDALTTEDKYIAVWHLYEE